VSAPRITRPVPVPARAAAATPTTVVGQVPTAGQVGVGPARSVSHKRGSIPAVAVVVALVCLIATGAVLASTARRAGLGPASGSARPGPG
jgi:hypothetical protein